MSKWRNGPLCCEVKHPWKTCCKHETMETFDQCTNLLKDTNYCAASKWEVAHLRHIIWVCKESRHQNSPKWKMCKGDGNNTRESPTIPKPNTTQGSDCFQVILGKICFRCSTSSPFLTWSPSFLDHVIVPTIVAPIATNATCIQLPYNQYKLTTRNKGLGNQDYFPSLLHQGLVK